MSEERSGVPARGDERVFATTAATARQDRPADAFQQLYDSRKGQVYRWALQFGAGRRAWAEDVVHDVFVRVFENLGSLTNLDDLGGFLYRVTANVAIGRLRKERGFFMRVRHFLREEEESSDPHEDLVLKEGARAALKQLAALPALERTVLTMKLFDGKRQLEIAETLSLSEGYVSKVLQRALTRVRAAGWEVDDA